MKVLGLCAVYLFSRTSHPIPSMLFFAKNRNIMIIETREVYKCGHCRKMYQKKYACRNHEKVCSKNLDNQRPCFNCQHLTKKIVKEVRDTGFSTLEVEFELLYCKSKDVFLYPPKNEILGNYVYLEEEINNPMPKDCDTWFYENACIMKSDGIISKLELSNFKEIVFNDVQIGREIYNGFKSRPNPIYNLPF